MFSPSLSTLLDTVRRLVRRRRAAALAARKSRRVRRAAARRPLDANARSAFAFRPTFVRAMARLLSVSLAAPFIAPGVAAAAGALPSGMQPTYGRSTATTTGNAVNVNLYTPVTVNNWTGGLSLGAGNSLNFTNSSGAVSPLTVNIDTSGARTNINGAINAPGVRVLEVNSNGFSIGSSASINAGAFVAAAGTAQVTPGAAGQAAQVQVDLVNAPVVVAPGASMHGTQPLAIGPDKQISMTATGAAATVPVMAGSIVDATLAGSNTAFNMNNGAIVGDQVKVVAQGGDLNVNQSTVSAGSELDLSGDNLSISGSTLTASDNGATVELGGGHRGQDASLPNASTTTIDQNTTIQTGVQSSVAVWSQDYTAFNGRIMDPSGNAEVSSAGTLNYGVYALADLAGPYGYGWLTLDPNMANISPGGTGSASGGYTTGGFVTIAPSTLSTQLDYSSVLFQATTGIQVDGTITGGAGTSLELASGGSISFTPNGHVNLNGGNLTITYNDQNAPAGTVGSNAFSFNGPGFVMSAGSSISTNGGSVTAAPGSYGGQTSGAVVIYSGATINTTTANGTGGNVSLTGVGLTSAQGANAISGAGVSIGGGANGTATITTGSGNVSIFGTGSAATGGNGVAINAGTIAGGDSAAVSTTSGAVSIQGTAGTNATGEDGVLIGGNNTSPTIQTGSGSVGILGSSTTQVGVSFEGGSVASATGNITVSGSGAAAATGGATNAQLTNGAETVEGIYANQSASLSTAGNVSMSADSAALYGMSIDANTITGTIAGGLNLSDVGTTTSAQTATTSIGWTAGSLQANGTQFTAPATTLTSTAGDLLVNGSQFTGDAALAAAGEMTFGVTTTTGSLGNSIGGSANPTSVSGSLTASGDSVNVEENLSAQNITLVSQNSLTIGTAAQAAANLPGPSVQAGDLLSLTVDNKNTNTGNFDPSSVLDNYGTAVSETGNGHLELSAPTGTGTQTVTVNPVPESNPAPINDPNVPHPGFTWVPNTPPAAQTGTVTDANNQLGDLAQYETPAMKAPGSTAYYDPATGRTIYNEPASVVPTPQTYVRGTWVLDTPPSNGGGGTTTPPGNGGGTTTPPGNGGSATTPPSNGGGETTPPSNPGNPTTPPVTPPVVPPTTPPAQPPAIVPTQALPAAVAPTTIVATPTTSSPTLQGNVLYVPSSNTPAAAGATLSLPEPSDAPSDVDSRKDAR